MALPFLPAEHIESVFHQLDQRARTDRVAAFMGYVWRQWFQSSTFGVRNWNVSMTSVRTNNNLEGWHNRINSRMNSRGPVQFYLLLQELYKEATAIPMQSIIVTEGKLERLHIKKTTRLNGKLFHLWEQYNYRDISTSKLLRKCSELYGPGDMWCWVVLLKYPVTVDMWCCIVLLKCPVTVQWCRGKLFDYI